MKAIAKMSKFEMMGDDLVLKFKTHSSFTNIILYNVDIFSSPFIFLIELLFFVLESVFTW